MANTNFIVHNGLTVGGLNIDAQTGNLTTSGNIASPHFTGNVIATTVGATGNITAPTFVGNATNALALNGAVATDYAKLASPAFTGSPTVNGIDVGYKTVPQNLQNTNYTIALSDVGKHIYSTDPSTHSVTIPTNANIALPVGSTISIINNGNANVTINSTGTTIYKAGDPVAWVSGGNLMIKGMASILKVDTDTWFISGVGLGDAVIVVLTNQLFGWGLNAYGQAGINNTYTEYSPIQAGSLTDWDSVSCGYRHVMAVKTDGTLWACGHNGDQFHDISILGIGDTIARSSPVQVGSLTNWSKVSAGLFHTLAVKTDGTLWSWGDNLGGGLGLGDVTSRSSPVQVGALTDWSKVSCGYLQSVAIKTDGTLWSWGFNFYGQLGLGTSGNGTSRSSPVQVGALTNWANVSYGRDFSHAIKTDGTLWAWGHNHVGQLGLGDVADRSSPVQVGALTDWASVDAGELAVAAIKTDGTLWTWGYNSTGELGLGDVTPRSSPVQVGALTDWSKCSTGFDCILAVKTDGTLWACGNNAEGQIAQGSMVFGTPVRVEIPSQVGALTNWSQVSCGYFDTSAVKTDGTLWSWGYNWVGQAGQGDVVLRSSPVQVGALTDWASVACSYHTAAVKTDGTLWTWGADAYGQLGLGDVTPRSSPVQVGALTDWAKVACGYRHTAAIKTDGTLWTWGDNTSGELGLDDITHRSSPVQVGALTNWASVSLNISWGFATTAAIKTDGTLWTWGNNWAGQLGHGDTTYRSSPVQVGALTNWSKVACGYAHTVAVKTDGTLWTWGDNQHSQLGSGDLVSRSSPVQVGALTDWSSVACGYRHTIASKTNNTVWSWGQNSNNQLGLAINDNIDKSSPVQIGALSTWQLITAGGNTSAAIKTDGSLWAWGAPTSGQTGVETNHWGANLAPVSSPVQVGSMTNWREVSVYRNTVVALT